MLSLFTMQANHGYPTSHVRWTRYLLGMVFIVGGGFLFPVLLISPALEFLKFVDLVLASRELSPRRCARWFPEYWLYFL